MTKREKRNDRAVTYGLLVIVILSLIIPKWNEIQAGPEDAMNIPNLVLLIALMYTTLIIIMAILTSGLIIIFGLIDSWLYGYDKRYCFGKSAITKFLLSICGGFMYVYCFIYLTCTKFFATSYIADIYSLFHNILIFIGEIAVIILLIRGRKEIRQQITQQIKEEKCE